MVADADCEKLIPAIAVARYNSLVEFFIINVPFLSLSFTIHNCYAMFIEPGKYRWL
jgi:hypothetical protein